MGSSSSKPGNNAPEVPDDELSEADIKIRGVLKTLNQYDTVIIVDDSGSMTQGQRWAQAGEALGQLASVASKYDQDGVDIRFLNSSKKAKGVKDPSEVENIFKKVSPGGSTPIGARFRGLLSDYFTRYAANPNKTKKVNFIMITDGAATDGPDDNVETIIVKYAKKLDELNAPITQVGIQFVQIGNDDAAKSFLEGLDDALKTKHHIRDIVDTTVSSSENAKLDLIKVLVGAINRRIDAGHIVTG